MSPQSRYFKRFGIRGWSAFLGTATIVMAIVASVGFTSLASAAIAPPVSVIKITDALPETIYSSMGSSYVYLSTDVNYPGGPAFLSLSPDGTGSTWVDDAIHIDIDPGRFGQSFDHDYSNGCTGVTPSPPMDISSFLSVGSHHLNISLMNRCSATIGSSSVYLVFMGSNPSPTPTPTPSLSLSPTPVPTTSPSPTPPGYKCGSIKLFGLRGSGEHNFEGEGMGSVVDDLKNRMALKISGLRFEAVDYPAIPVDFANPAYASNYIDSEMAGRDALLRAVRTFMRYCPTTYAVIAGYSQGAQAAGDAYDLLSYGERQQVSGLIMFGDPVFNPGQPVIDRGDYNAKLSGILTTNNLGWYDLRSVPRRWVPRVESYCSAGDPICNYNKRNLARCVPIPGAQGVLCPHLRYIQGGATKEAARWAVTQWQRLPKLR